MFTEFLSRNESEKKFEYKLDFLGLVYLLALSLSLSPPTSPLSIFHPFPFPLSFFFLFLSPSFNGGMCFEWHSTKKTKKEFTAARGEEFEGDG